MSQYKTAKEVAEEIILDHASDIEWMSIGEMIENRMDLGHLPQMEFDEFEQFQEDVDGLISQALVEVHFE